VRAPSCLVLRYWQVSGLGAVALPVCSLILVEAEATLVLNFFLPYWLWSSFL
jgi:hypothetical protein